MELLFYLQTVGNSVGVVLHSAGLFLLWKARNVMDKTQVLFLFNLSLVELVACVFMIVVQILKGLYKYPLHLIPLYFTVELLNVSLNLSMIFLTFERLLRLVLNYRYPLHWSVGRTKFSLSIIWIISFSAAGGVIAVFTVYGSQTREMCRTIVNMVLFAVFIAFALATYGFAIRQVCSTNVTSANRMAEKQRARRLLKGFTVGGLIILTYLMFWLIPQVWLAYYQVFRVDVHFTTRTEYQCMMILNILAVLTDPLIYIFLSPKIRHQIGACWKGTKRKFSTQTSITK